MRSLVNNTQVLVVGGGVSGLRMALYLHQNGFQETVVAEKSASQIISAVADLTFENAPPI
jgi:2-polyprenyl-6-methoxyphenol hydroxylase-like FAD-dependent oxidoreductase